MKTKFHYCLLLSFAVTFSICRMAKAQVTTTTPTLIQFWDFNNTPSVGNVGNGGDSLGNGATTLVATQTVSGVTAGHIIYSRPSKKFGSSGERDSILDNGSHATGGSFIYDFTKTNDSTNGNVFVRTRNPSDSCEFIMYIPTTGYKNIQLEYAISASSTKGAIYNIFSYSTNSGTTWKNLTKAMDTFNISGVYRPDTLQAINPTTSISSWYPVQIDFTSDPSVDNNANFVFKFRLAGYNSVDTGGNDRYDNFAVLGIKKSAGIDEISAQAAGYNVYPNPAQNLVNIISSYYNGEKQITIYNMVGQKVNVMQSSAVQTTINTSSLNAGVYFIEISEGATGNTYTTKIIKQ